MGTPAKPGVATTVRVRYHVEGTATEKKKTSPFKAEGLLLLKGDGKVLLRNRMRIEGVDSPEPDGVLVSCDQQSAHGTVDVAIVHVRSPASFQRCMAA